MSDAAFKTARYPAYTTAQLREFIAKGSDSSQAMLDEIDRRDRVASGDMSVATPGERIRAVKEERR